MSDASSPDRGEMRTIMEVVPMRPMRLVCQEKKWNVGLKLGAEARSRPRHARLTDPYERRNKTEQS